MATPAKPDGLAKTGGPDDPAKKENPDTREEQLNRDDDAAKRDDRDPALQTTREAGQGSG